MKTKYQHERDLSHKLNSIAKKFDTTGLKLSFDLIRRHGFAHTAVDNRDKGQSAREMCRILKKIYRGNMTSNMSELRNKCYQLKSRRNRLRNMFLHADVLGYRRAFEQWKRAAQADSTVIEVNLIGPVVEEVLEHRLDVGNLQNFMRKEGYTEDEVWYATDSSRKRANYLLSKSIGRMKHYNEEKYVIPKMFDRWRFYVKMRKLAKHWMEYIGNRQNAVQADLAVAFDRWK